jgi:hypothetical protein
MSDRKIKANRANARASTGPQIASGRARSAGDALRHALSPPVCSNPVLSEEVETLARQIAGPDANAETQELARQDAGSAPRALCAASIPIDVLSDQYYDSHGVNLKWAKAPDMSMAVQEEFLTKGRTNSQRFYRKKLRPFPDLAGKGRFA